MAALNPAQWRQLWLGALTGPVAWSVSFLVGYALIEAACYLQLLTQPVGGTGLSMVALLLVGLMLLTLLPISWAAWLAWGHWQRLQRAGATGATRDAERLLAVGGLLLSGLFAFLTLAAGLPPLMLAPCA